MAQAWLAGRWDYLRAEAADYGTAWRFDLASGFVADFRSGPADDSVDGSRVVFVVGYDHYYLGVT